MDGSDFFTNGILDMAKRAESHDGTIFQPPMMTPDDPGLAYERLTARKDTEAQIRVIRHNVEGWLKSPASQTATPATLESANTLISLLESITQKTDAITLIELGYLLCQFSVQAGGFEALAGIGKSVKRQWPKATPITDQARNLIAAGASIRNIAKACGVGEKVVRKWREDFKEKKF